MRNHRVRDDLADGWSGQPPSVGAPTPSSSAHDFHTLPVFISNQNRTSPSGQFSVFRRLFIRQIRFSCLRIRSWRVGSHFVAYDSFRDVDIYEARPSSFFGTSIFSLSSSTLLCRGCLLRRPLLLSFITKGGGTNFRSISPGKHFYS